MTTIKFNIIVAYEKNTRIIGVNAGSEQKMPWPILKTDLRHFREVTMHTNDPGKQNAVIMGRKTWETLPDQFRPLPKRLNIILSRQKNYFDFDGAACPENTKLFDNLEMAIGFCNFDPMIESVFVIGGGEIYRQALHLPSLNKIYATEVKLPSDSVESEDYIRFPELSMQTWHRQHVKSVDDSGHRVMFTEYYKLDNIRPRGSLFATYDERYLNCLRNIMGNGTDKMDRTGHGTVSTFGLTYNAKFKKVSGDDSTETYTFPLLTTKRMFLRGIIKELLFFLRGDVDNDKLAQDGVKIWNGNTTREFLDNRGLQHMETGSLGKAYGFQWRHWGAEWQGKTHDYKSSPGRHDQIAEILETLKNNPNSRRMVLSAWNVGDLPEMCLPPCHMVYVFNVQYHREFSQETQNVELVPKLYCHMTQRSADMFLGVPFNIASTALLTMILAQAAGIEPGGIMITFCDAHIYNHHMGQVHAQLERESFRAPHMRITKKLNTVEDIESLEYEDFELTDYYYHPTIKASMAI